MELNRLPENADPLWLKRECPQSMHIVKIEMSKDPITDRNTGHAKILVRCAAQDNTATMDHFKVNLLTKGVSI